ncbi:regulator of chromosome condensation [Anaeramoeba ignava]|uniref:Regulator of chromosome condensation n=1 Tax=Anaeramoeba ignava TaxID=1746090 RepID=A0A9Q0RCT2_ANAIG|nr:regulator of chromosome condensation [Anaeramoeba ignava]
MNLFDNQKNEIIFFGRNEYPTFYKNKSNEIKNPIQFKFENENENENENEKENENENEKQIKQILSGKLSIVFLFKNGKAIEYLRNSNSNQKPQKIEMKKIQKVSVGWQNEAILTSEGNVLVKGESISFDYPNQFINISSLIEDPNDRTIQDIVSGYSSIYLLTSNHNVYGIGSNEYGQLGFDSDSLYQKTEKPILMMKNVSKIFSGNSSKCVFLLNSNQELFGCGYNQYDQIGLGKSFIGAKIKKLTKIPNIPKGKIIDIKCGAAYSIMLIEDENENENPKRKLYSCGEYRFNGLGKNLYTDEFTEIKSPLFENDNILDFSVTYNHTLILTEKGKLIGFGSNCFGELGIGNTEDQKNPIQIELPKLRFNEDISNYHIYCGYHRSFLYYSPSFSNLEEDLIKLFGRKEFCNISFKTENGEIIKAHKLILKYRLKDQNENQIEKLKEIISKKSIKESNQIFEMIYSNRIINPKLYSEIKEIINSNEKIEETMKRIYLNENENNFIIERKEKQYKFPKLILIMRSELYRGMFLSVTEDTSNKVTDYSELSNKSFQIFEYWIYSNQIKKGIQITQEIIDEIKIGIDYFQLNQTNPNLFDLLIRKFKKQQRKALFSILFI